MKLNQAAQEATDVWDRALKTASGCYYSAGCEESPIQAHTLSKAWMRPLARNNKVMWFASRSVAGMLETLRLARPTLVSVKAASSHPYCCKAHDKYFVPIDNAEAAFPATRNHLNLMFLRGLLRQLYYDSVLSKFQSTYPWMETIKTANRIRVDAESVRQLKEARTIIQQEITTQRGKSGRVAHIVKYIPGAPQIACAGASTWNDGIHDADVEGGIRGFTVIPYKAGHMVAYHCCTVVPDNPEVSMHTMRRRLTQLLRPDQGMPQRVSVDILAHCEEVCLSPDAWDTYPEDLKTEIQLLSMLNLSTGGGSDINLFTRITPSQP